MRKKFVFIVLVLSLFVRVPAFGRENIAKINSLPAAQWQKIAVFPDWLGRVDDTLALNSMVSFHYWHAQGSIYVKIPENVTFDMFINNHFVNTSSLNQSGNYEINISDYTVNGINTIQISNVNPRNKKISVYIPYPVIINGSLEDSGIRPETVSLISEIINSDIKYGFPSAQLAIIRNGMLVYSNAWGDNVNTNTLYDLASVTKMFTVNYAIQKLVTDGKLNIDNKIIDIIGHDFANDTIYVNYKNANIANLKTIKNWKASITVRDVLCHRAGFPSEIHYQDSNFNIVTLRHDSNSKNVLYTGVDGSPETRAKTLKAIFKTPLMYKPRTKIVYSDIDYMLLCFVVEKITGKRLDVYMRENFWLPMNLNRIAFNPLRNNFSGNECAPTEIYGNTRDKNMTFKGIRTYTLRGEVHDYKAFHSMGGISGHAGLFSNAEDIAKLASIMLNGGYGFHKFFAKDVIDMFTSPQSHENSEWGVGWWREGDNKRVWYFGTQSSSNTFGHQGWTGTLVMIDPSRNLVIAYLTNKINSEVVKPYTGKKIFYGNWFTSSTLGFVSQILYIGMDSENDVSRQLLSLLTDMANDSKKLIPSGAGANHPSVLNSKSKFDLLKKLPEKN